MWLVAGKKCCVEPPLGSCAGQEERKENKKRLRQPASFLSLVSPQWTKEAVIPADFPSSFTRETGKKETNNLLCLRRKKRTTTTWRWITRSRSSLHFSGFPSASPQQVRKKMGISCFLYFLYIYIVFIHLFGPTGIDVDGSAQSFYFLYLKRKKSSRCGVADSCNSHFSFLGPRAFESNSFSPTFQHSDRIFPFLTGMEPWKNNTFVNDERKRTDDLSRVVAPTHHHHKFPLSLLSGFSSAIQRRKKKKEFLAFGRKRGIVSRNGGVHVQAPASRQSARAKTQ